ncbi:DapH/DapD/GlmU-related protein [Paenarthrobacter sp. YJN-5]|uniref:acyltransferase n=1 Tax=Paenarthrobacter sp. YJN-5 TaxID=2735316 RepID=UPI001877CFB1|nr:acyltransferase [Paenarthrobacter sp. YJN-5]QOT16042.1 acyltransferase [Paenarthrobacter sp. YJN-5]
MGNTLAQKVRLAAYWMVAKNLPASTSPGGALWRKARAAVAGPLFAEVGNGINVEHGASFGKGDRIRIGDRSGIGINSRLDGPVTIGRDVMMGPEVMIYALGHNFTDTDTPMIEQGMSVPREVVIEDDVWIGARAIILPGVTIGTGSVVAASAVVTKSVPPFSVVAGNPARLVKSRLAEVA